MTAFIRPKGKHNAGDLLDLFSRMEKTMADLMAELSPEAGLDKADLINLRLVAQRLKDKGFDTATTDICTTLLHIMAGDQGESGGKSLKIAGKKGAEQQRVFVNVPWQILKERMDLRHRCARVCIEAIIKNLEPDLKSAPERNSGPVFPLGHHPGHGPGYFSVRGSRETAQDLWKKACSFCTTPR